MTITMPAEKEQTLVPAGTHNAICCRVVDIGTQATSFGPRHQLFFSWELTDETMNNGRPFIISRRYNYSADRKASLRIDIEGWLGRTLDARDFGTLDLSTMLGRTCLVGVKHETRDGRTFANVTSIMKPPKETMERLPPMTEAVALSLADRPFAHGDFDALPPWLRDLVAKSPEYQTAIEPQAPNPEDAHARHKAMLLVQPPKPKRKTNIFGPGDDLADDHIPF